MTSSDVSMAAMAVGQMATVGPVALVGGAEWQEGCTFDRVLWETSGRAEILVLPTAAAYEHPERAVETAAGWFARFGASSRGLMVLNRRDAEDGAHADDIAAARFVYLSGGSPLHLRSVLKGTPVWSAIGAAWRSGAVLAGSSAGAMVLGDPMVDPRGGALTLGLGLLPGLAVLPHRNRLSPETSQRSLRLASGSVTIAAIDEATALIRSPDGTWSVDGLGAVDVHGEAGGTVPLPVLEERLRDGGPVGQASLAATSRPRPGATT